MAAAATPPPAPLARIGIYGPDVTAGPRHGSGLWPAGIVACIKEAGGEGVFVAETTESGWADVMEGIDGLVIVGHDAHPRRSIADAEGIVSWCHDKNIPVLAIDHGMHILNSAHGGTTYNDVARDQPEALQHRHPPEKGLRHAINVLPDTIMADLYGEGEVVVNSEHRKAVARVARGFKVSAQALDGVTEAIESTGEWFALGVQWNPTSSTSTGLDIQLFRSLIRAITNRDEPAEVEEEVEVG